MRREYSHLMLIVLKAIQEGGKCYFVPGFFEKIDQRSTESSAFMGLTDLRSKATVWGECGKERPWEPMRGHSEPERAFTDSVTTIPLCLLPSKKKKQVFPLQTLFPMYNPSVWHRKDTNHLAYETFNPKSLT